jgi:lipid-A-disaccharide synthase
VPTKEEARRLLGHSGSELIVGLLPGSREGEVRHHLPVLKLAVDQMGTVEPRIRFLVAVADTLPPGLVETLLQGSGPAIRLVRGQTYQVMRAADLVITASGTATLEAGLLGTPMVIVYRVSLLTWWAGKLLVDVPSIGMVNLVVGRRVVPELLQWEFTPNRVAETALGLVRDPAALDRIRRDLREVRGRLGEEGASRRAAQEILTLLYERGAGSYR